jgi:NADH-quinone oxidoreductase subunit I
VPLGIGTIFKTAVTNLFKQVNTVMFPADEVPTPEGFRGRPVVARPEDCIVCNICEKICPTHCISIVPIEQTAEDVEKEIQRSYHHIWISQCMQCQECVDRCPKDCFDMTDNWKSAALDKNDPELHEEVIVQKRKRNK